MEAFIQHLFTFNPIWIGGSLIFGYFLGKIFNAHPIFFIPPGYLLFVFPTLKLSDILRTSSFGSEVMSAARSWALSTYDTASLMVVLTALLVSGIFWALSQ